MSTYEVPLTASAQTLTIPINGNTYNIVIYWRGNQYVLDLYDDIKTPIIVGIALITGVNLLKPYNYLSLGFEMSIFSDVDITLIPQYTTLGVSSHLHVTY